METRISSSSKEVIISNDNRTELLGKRIDPVDKKKLLEAPKVKKLEAKLDNLS